MFNNGKSMQTTFGGLGKHWLEGNADRQLDLLRELRDAVIEETINDAHPVGKLAEKGVIRTIGDKERTRRMALISLLHQLGRLGQPLIRRLLLPGLDIGESMGQCRLRRSQ